MARVLIIDDDPGMCDTLYRMIRLEGHEGKYVQTLREGLSECLFRSYDLVLLDVMMPDGSGLDLLPKINKISSPPQVIIMTAAGSPDGAEIAIASGAWDYLQKPFSFTELKLQIVRALQYRDEKMQNKPVVPSLRLEGIVGRSPEMMQCMNLIGQAATTDANVLIIGATGTGKELFARAIHESGPLAGKNFVVVDCGALPDSLVESILFGHEKGAFTGAEREAEGLIRQADGGTLFLDEIGELPLSVQKSFLRVIQERSFRPVGGRKEVRSNFRLIAATNRNLGELTKSGGFREDLLFRLRAIVMELPPLKGRTGDILDLLMHYMRSICDRFGLGLKGFSPEFLEALLVYHWPGNVREFIHSLESSLAAAREAPTLYRLHLPAPIRVHMAVASFQRREVVSEQSIDEPAQPFEQESLREVIRKSEGRYLKSLMMSTQGNISEACRISGLSRTRLYENLRKHGLQRNGMQNPESETRSRDILSSIHN
ncbi:MAG: sigma-54-dependent Fis family transcriptional regulator [Desulfobacteraceae bacterium]|nr:MAG: sigma-54-dependent Fis family transcriptional regulator [Desulfobacteraceae bacterium]